MKGSRIDVGLYTKLQVGGLLCAVLLVPGCHHAQLCSERSTTRSQQTADSTEQARSPTEPQQSDPKIAKLREQLTSGQGEVREVLALCDDVLRGQSGLSDLWLKCAQRALGPAVVEPTWLEVALRHAESAYATGASAQAVAEQLSSIAHVAEQLRVWPLVRSAYARIASLPVKEAEHAAKVAKCSTGLSPISGDLPWDLNDPLVRAGRRAMRGAQFERASNALGVAASISDDTTVRERLVEANLKAGRLDCAEIETQRLLHDARNEQQRSHALYLLGLIHEATGDKDKARSSFADSNRARVSLEASRKLRGPHACAVSLVPDQNFSHHTSANEALAAIQPSAPASEPSNLDAILGSAEPLAHSRAGLNLRLFTSPDSHGRQASWVVGTLADGSLFTRENATTSAALNNEPLELGHFRVTRRWVTYDLLAGHRVAASYLIDLELKRAWSISYAAKRGRYHATDDAIVVSTDGCTERLKLRDVASAETAHAAHESAAAAEIAER